MSRGQNGDGEDSAKSARMTFAPCSRLEDPSAVRSPVLRGEARTISGDGADSSIAPLRRGAVGCKR